MHTVGMGRYPTVLHVTIQRSSGKHSSPCPVFPHQTSCFSFVRWWHPFTVAVWCVQRASSPHPVCVCPPQNTTDSSSNSSQKLESSLQPLESSPLPQRHKCMMGHRLDLHDPYRLSDHYLLDQVRRGKEEHRLESKQDGVASTLVVLRFGKP